MRLSQAFFVTLRENPAEADLVSHQLLHRAGFVRNLAAGIYSFLPLGLRVKQKIENIFREEFNAIGGQEVLMPMVHPAELWQETGRWYAVGGEMVRFKDRTGRDMVLGMTHEEVITDIVRRMVKSYRDLPVLVYQIQEKFRDEPRARGGLIRTREFTMKDLYSFHADWEGLDGFYREIYQSYFNVFFRCGLETVAVLSDTGMMGGTMAHEYMYLNEIGEDTLVICRQCGYSANRQVAVFVKEPLPSEAPLPVEEVATPGASTIEDLAKLLDIPREKTAKAMFYAADGKLVFVVIRGDMDVNETKLTNLLKVKQLRPAHPEEIRSLGAVPGYASPLGLSGDFTLVVDDLIPKSVNLVAGANREGYHLLNTNFGRDYTSELVADVAAAGEGDSCIRCGSPLQTVRGVEVGNIFKLGLKYSEAMGATYLDREGRPRPMVMGSYGIGSGRLMACVVEEHHDDKGMIWPISIAPYQVYLLTAGRKNPSLDAAADQIYQGLLAAGLEVLYDDREESPGVKFGDADLIGIPLRVTVGRRALEQGEVELRWRHDGRTETVKLAAAVDAVAAAVQSLQDDLAESVKVMPFEA